VKVGKAVASKRPADAGAVAVSTGRPTVAAGRKQAARSRRQDVSRADGRCCLCRVRKADVVALRTYTHPDGLTEYAAHPAIPRGVDPPLVCRPCGAKLDRVVLQRVYQ